MRTNYILSAIAGLAMTAGFSACDEERDFIIIEDNLPIKTSALYMVGDATPVGWNIDAPEPMTVDPNDGCIFTWEGVLNTGEMKLPLATGSWSVGFIRPSAGHENITSEEQVDVPFIMHSGDPDEKWQVKEAGKYFIKINLRNWTFSCRMTGEKDPVEIVPIEAEAVYIVGDATPNGWDISNAFETEKVSQYIFRYTGILNKGEMKACTERDASWSCPFIRPSEANVAINADGVANTDFVYTTGPDDKWLVEAAGKYEMTFDLQNWKVEVKYLGAPEPEPEPEPSGDPIETNTLYIIGDATEGGWSLDAAQECTKDGYKFTWTGVLTAGGTFKACPVKDFNAPFIRPEYDNISVGEQGVASPVFIYTTSPDNKWLVAADGIYTLTFDLEKYTINAKYEGEAVPTVHLYIVGDATPNGWDIGKAWELQQDAADENVFTFTGQLSTGEMKACHVRDTSWGCPFYRPTTNGVTIGENGVSNPDCIFTVSDDSHPDYKWTITKAGKYTIKFNLKELTIEANYLDE